MAKRVATSELTDRNWDQEDEAEEVGVFVQATSDVLKNRPMKKAKRRGTTEPAGGSAFSAFSGFSGLSSRKETNETSKQPTTGSVLTSSNITSQSTTSSTTTTTTNNNNRQNTSYYHSLKSLNKSVLEWMKKHIERDPYCILTPIFSDYNKHLENIKKNNNNDDVKTDTSTSDGKEIGNDSDPEIVFKTKVTNSAPLSTENKPMSSIFGNSNTSGFSFAPSTTTTTTSNITGLGTTGFTFNVTKPPVTTTGNTDNKEGEEEEEYVPPKAETREITEEGSVYTKRCKIFYQKDGNWKDRGVGNLHLKPVDNDKTQLIIRADTTLGNILLNIMLSSVIPTKKQGKNNVWMLCVPNPPIDAKDDSGKPVPMLLRVKTSEDADELLSKLEEMKR